MTIIYQMWDGGDMANSDSYFPTLAEAVRDARANYGIKGEVKLDDEGEWEGVVGPDCGSSSGMDVHIRRRKIDTSREGLCWALKLVPHR